MATEIIPLKTGQHSVVLVPRATTDLPFFYLTKQKVSLTQNIDYQGVDLQGRPLRWQVFPNSNPAIGAPAIDAHEAWMRLIKPTFDNRLEANEALEIVPLGKIRECLRSIGWGEGGWEARRLFKALHQMGAASCVADMWIPTSELDVEGNPVFQHINATFSKLTIYAIGSKHLTDEQLKSGKFNFDFELEDTLYVQLHPVEVQIQKSQPQRYIDNQYLFSVKPSPRRWYELMAAKIFGVVKNKGEFCEVRYSWYVKHHHTLKRHHQHKRVTEQMNEIVKDHLASDYIRKVEYRKIKESDQEIDFIIRYYPGEGAKESIARIQGYIYNKRHQQKLTAKENHQQEQGTVEQPTLETLAPTLTEEEKQLIRKLNTEFEIAIMTARQLVKDYPEAVKAQLEYWPSRSIKFHTGKAGWMIAAIKQNYAPASNWQEQKQQEEAKQEHQVRAAKRESQKRAYEQYRSDTIDNYIQEHAGEYEAILEALMNRLRKTAPNPLMQGMARNEISQRIELLTYETYCAGHHPPPSDPTNNTPLEALELTQERRIDEQGSVTPPHITKTIQEPLAHATEPQPQPHHNTLPPHLL